MDKRNTGKYRKRTDETLFLLNIKISEDEKEKFDAKARRYTKGNISQWLRLAGSRYVPKKEKVS